MSFLGAKGQLMDAVCKRTHAQATDTAGRMQTISNTNIQQRNSIKMMQEFVTSKYNKLRKRTLREYFSNSVSVLWTHYFFRPQISSRH